MSIAPFERPQHIARLASERFRPGEVRQLLGLSTPGYDAWTTGAASLPLVSPKGRGRGGRLLCLSDVWTLAIYQRLVRLTDAGMPVKTALARFLEDHLFAELKLPETYEYLTWLEANPALQFKPGLNRTQADLDWHREAIRAKVAADPGKPPAMWWSRDENRPWFVAVDLDLLAKDKLALKSGGELCPLTIRAGCDMPEFWEVFTWPPAVLFVNVTQLLADIDDRLLAIVAARNEADSRTPPQWPEPASPQG